MSQKIGPGRSTSDGRAGKPAISSGRLHRPHHRLPPRIAARFGAAASAVALLLLASCKKPAPPTPTADEPKAEGSAAPEKGSDAGSSAPSTVARPDPPGSGPCGELGCLKFPTAVDAFRFVMSHDPLVLAVGEAHAQKGAEGVASSTKRFTDELLPLLKGRTENLVLELWIGTPSCGAVVQKVKKHQKPVVEKQAEKNPSELIALGDKAKALGIRPMPLTPSCADYDPIAHAGDDAVPLMLELIARLTREKLTGLLPGTPPGQLVLAYGGAMHNDVSPVPGRERYAFGRALSQSTNGRYIELDVIVGDFVKNAEPWNKLPWVKPYLSLGRSDRVILFRPYAGSFVLIYPPQIAATSPTPQ